MIDLIHPLAQAYAERYSSGLGALLEENESYTAANHPKAHMHSGRVQGLFLSMISRMLKPSRVLDIGTFTGFSALCLAEGLTEDGVLHTIECREEDAQTAASFISRSGRANQINLHTGDARTIIPTLKETWDLVFIDADKVSYIDYYELTLQQTRPGGWILADNVFFHGDVLQETPSGKNAKAIHAFNEHVAADKRVESVMLTIRDGLFIIRKL